MLDGGTYLTGEFAVVLDEFAQARNPAAHGGTVERAVVAMWRDRLLGVGAHSVITRLAGVRRRSLPSTHE